MSRCGFWNHCEHSLLSVHTWLLVLLSSRVSTVGRARLHFPLERSSSVGILGCHLDHGCYTQMKYLLQRRCSHSLGELLGEGAHVACFLMHMGHVLTYPESWAQSSVSQGPHQPFSSQIMRVIETSCLKERPSVTHSWPLTSSSYPIVLIDCLWGTQLRQGACSGCVFSPAPHATDLDG